MCFKKLLDKVVMLDTGQTDTYNTKESIGIIKRETIVNLKFTEHEWVCKRERERERQRERDGEFVSGSMSEKGWYEGKSCKRESFR